jgi:predicted HicB family RNase H-like nuclease
MLECKGYLGTYEPDQGLLFGRVVDIRDVITFVRQTPAEVEEAFQQSVDDYLDFCRERGEVPEAPPSGTRQQGWTRKLAQDT